MSVCVCVCVCESVCVCALKALPGALLLCSSANSSADPSCSLIAAVGVSAPLFDTTSKDAMHILITAERSVFYE